MAKNGFKIFDSDTHVGPFVDVLDPYTVRVNLKRPAAMIMTLLTSTGGFMVSPKAMQTYGDDYSGLTDACFLLMQVCDINPGFGCFQSGHYDEGGFPPGFSLPLLGGSGAGSWGVLPEFSASSNSLCSS